MSKIRMGGFAALAAVTALAGALGGAHAAPDAKKGPAAAGKVSKLDTAARTFVVSSKKRGETTVSYSDTTKFMKAPAEAGTKATEGAVADLKDGVVVRVQGTQEAGKVQATQITIGGAKRKKNKAGATQ